MGFMDGYSTMFFDASNPAVGTTQSEPTAEMSFDQFLELPGERRRAAYDVVSGLMLSDHTDEINDSMIMMLAYGVMHEEDPYRPTVTEPGPRGEWVYTEFLQNAQQQDPAAFASFNKAVQSDFTEMINDEEYRKEVTIGAGMSLIGAVAAGIAGFGLIAGGTAAGMGALSLGGGAVALAGAFHQAHPAISWAVRGLSTVVAGGGVILSTFLNLQDDGKTQQDIESGVTDEKNAELEEAARLRGEWTVEQQEAFNDTLDQWEGMTEAEQVDLQSKFEQGAWDVVDRAAGWFNQLGGTPLDSDGNPVSEMDQATNATNEEIADLTEQIAVTTEALGAKFDSGQQVTWSDAMDYSESRKKTYGSLAEPLPWASAPEYDETSYGVPGRYKISADRQPYLVSKAMTAEMEAARSRLEAGMPGLGEESKNAGYEQVNLPPYTTYNPQAVPQESYYFVPPDFTAKWIDNFGNTVYREPRYKESDNDAFFALRTFTPDYLATFQQQMVDAHVMFEGRFLPGMPDKATLSALQVTMGQANFTGEWYKSVAGQMAEAGKKWGGGGRSGGGYVRPPFVKRTYVKPDYEEMSLAAKETFRVKLNRDPHEWEMKILADKLGDEHKRGFDSVEEARWKDYQRGTGGNKLTSETIEGVENPVDVMRNYFDRQWAPELARAERVEVERRGAERFFNSMLQTDARIFGGRSEAMTQKVGQ